MPTLQVLRHAQAQPFAARDHERALTADGVASAGAAGRIVAATGVPDLVLTSTARRTLQTLREAMRAGDWSADVVELDALYGGAVDEVLEALASEAPDRASTLVVGHEPWCSGLVGLLTGAQVRMTPGALAVMEVGPGWDALDPAWCALTTFVPGWVADRVTVARRGRVRRWRYGGGDAPTPQRGATVFNRAPAVDVPQAQELLADGATLIDVRRADEWQAGHAPDAMHIPLDALPDRVGDVPADHRVIAVCRSGARSGRATMYLRGFGLDVVNLTGGMQAWARAGGEIVSDRGGRGYVS